MICFTCKIEKDDEDFAWRIVGVKRSSKCRSCQNLYSQLHYQNNKEAYIARARKREVTLGKGVLNRKYTYGVSAEKYAELQNMYDGKCHICRTRKGTSIDHDHSCCAGTKSCGKCIRGLLCIACNTSLGMMQDNTQWMRQAIVYLSTPLVEVDSSTSYDV